MSISEWLNSPWAIIAAISSLTFVGMLFIRRWGKRKARISSLITSANDLLPIADFDIDSEQVLAYARSYFGVNADSVINGTLSRLALQGQVHVRAAFWLETDLNYVPAFKFETYAMQLEEDRIISLLSDVPYHHLRFVSKEINGLWDSKRAKNHSVLIPDMPIIDAAKYALKVLPKPDYYKDWEHDKPRLGWACQRIQELAADGKIRVWGGLEKAVIPEEHFRNPQLGFVLDTCGNWFCDRRGPTVSGKEERWITPYVCRHQLESVLPAD